DQLHRDRRDVGRGVASTDVDRGEQEAAVADEVIFPVQRGRYVPQRAAAEGRDRAPPRGERVVTVLRREVEEVGGGGRRGPALRAAGGEGPADQDRHHLRGIGGGVGGLATEVALPDHDRRRPGCSGGGQLAREPAALRRPERGQRVVEDD